MNSHGQDRIVGFDRKIRLEWLDATARWTAEGRTPTEIRALLRELLEGSVAGMRARSNTITVLIRVWVQVPGVVVPLRDEGLRLIGIRKRSQRLPVHWGMCVVTHPFLRSVASMTGRLLAVQGTATLSQITRRVTQQWGERSTVIRATQRVVRSFVLWGVLKEADDRGIFLAAPRLAVGVGDLAGPWLVEAALTRGEGSIRTLRSLVEDTSLFPFKIEATAKEVSRRAGVEVHRQGLDEEVVVRVPARGRK